MSTNKQPQTPDAVAQLQRQVEDLAQRVETLETEVEERDERIEELEAENEELSAKVSALSSKAGLNTARLSELQSRELEKGAHLLWENLDGIEKQLSIDGGKIERFDGDDGEKYARLPGEADPLSRSGTSRLAQGDLLPIQQLSRLDEDMLRSTTDSLPSRLAAKLWDERTQDDIAPWSKGSSSVRQYLDSSDLRHWIRRVESGISEEYAKKLAQRTMDAVEDLAKDRLYSQRKARRKDGLRYKERRLIVPTDADIPGEREG